MSDIIGSISVIRNFMGNSNRFECNDVLFQALKDAIECMGLQIPDDVSNKSIISPNRVGFFCPHCGVKIKHPEDKSNFCSVCGKALNWKSDLDLLEDDPLLIQSR